MTATQAAIAALQIRRAVRGMSDPLNRLRAYGATQEPIAEMPYGQCPWNACPYETCPWRKP